MKKIAILTSLLALTACGGGSGGDANAPALSAIESNANVTGMNSFVVIGGSNPTVNPNARVATGGSVQSDGGRVYDLENVTFKSIPGTGVIADLVFHTNEEGKIISFEYPDAQAIMDNGGCDVTVGPLERVGDTNVFVEHAVLDEEFGERAGQTVDIPSEYISYAKNLGLKYSDFGIIRTDIAATGIPELQVWGVDETPFAGGYDIKNISNTDMNTLAQSGNIVFTGLAKGSVSYFDWNEGVGGAGISLPGGLTDNNARLIFATDGSQTLTANFTNWANIEAIKAANGTNQFTVHESYVGDDSGWYLAPGTHAGLIDGEINEHSMTFQTGYYGDDGNPVEAVGLLQYQYETGWNPSIDDYDTHINLNLGFGGTK